jgi:uncharacterized circularly permuted ATP-grasp superfamily protein
LTRVTNATALTPSLGAAAPVYEPGGHFDEALEPSGLPRPHYAELMARLRELELPVLAARVRDDLRSRGVSFGGAEGSRLFAVDPVPRLLERQEWELLERGVAQRAAAINAFIADVYDERRIVAAGLISVRTIESADHFEPWMLGVPAPGGHAPVAGLDVVRDARGELIVLEDNLRTPSGMTYAAAARHAVDRALPMPPPPGRLDLEPSFELLAGALRRAAPGGDGDPSIALLTDGPSNSAWWEHRVLARRLGIPLVTRRELHLRRGRLHAVLQGSRSREIQVLYRRTDDDRLQDDQGRATWLAEGLLDPVRRGHLAVVNAFGAGVADDKAVHPHVDDMVRFYLGEEPLLESVHSFDLSVPAARAEALERLDELVVKPRTGHGGSGVVVMAHAQPALRDRIAAAVRAQPRDWVAQETVMLSRHPTVVGAHLEPRHVDLRAFAVGPGVAPALLTRVALEPGSLIVNTSQTGGGKDTWVLS